MSIKRYKMLLKLHGILGKDMAERLGLQYDSYRSETRNKQAKYPRWLLGFIIGYDMGRTVHLDKHTTKYKRLQKLKRDEKARKKAEKQK